MNMKKALTIVLALMMTLALVACGSEPAPAPAPSEEAKPGEAAPAGEPEFKGNYVIGTGSATGNYFQFASAVTTVANKATGANITVNSTGGSTENARLLGSGEIEFAMMQSDVFYQAHHGTETFKDKAITNFKAVTACYPEMVQIVVRKDANIKSIPDLKGKKVNVGAVGSGTEVGARTVLAAYGMTYDDVKVQYSDQATGKNGLQDGTLDCTFWTSGYPNGNITELSLNGNIELVTIDDEHIEKLVTEYPYYTKFTTETDEYKLGHPVTSISPKCCLACSDKFTEDEIYALTKAIYENLPEIQEINAKARYMKLEDALKGLSSDLHPGAAKYFAEKGLEIPDYLK